MKMSTCIRKPGRQRTAKAAITPETATLSTAVSLFLFLFIFIFTLFFSFPSAAANINDPSPESFIDGVSLQKKVIVDTDGLRITAERLEITEDTFDSSNKVSVIFRVENRSSENVHLMTSSFGCYVNDQQVGGGSEMLDIPKGETQSLALVTLTPASLSSSGIQYIRTIENSLFVRIGESGKSSTRFLSEKYTLETTSTRTGEAVVPFAGSCLHDGDGVKIYAVTEEITSNYGGKLFLLRVENHSGHYLELKAPLGIMYGGSLKAVTGPNRYSDVSLPDGKAATLTYFPELGFRSDGSASSQFELNIQAEFFDFLEEKTSVASKTYGPFRFRY